MKKINRFIIYLVGIVFLALGSVLGVKSTLGVSTVSALPLNISMLTNMSMGTASTLIFIFFIIIQIIILKKEFKVIQLTQIIASIIFGQLINILNSIININIENIALKILVFVGALLCTSIGIVFTISVKLVPLPPDGLLQVISTKFNKEFGKLKISFDCVNVGIAVALTAVFGLGIGGVGIGTIIAAIVTGKIIAIINKAIGKELELLIFIKDEIAWR